MTTEAGPKARFGGRRGGGEEADVLGARLRRAAGTAEDAGGEHRRVELAVEAWIVARHDVVRADPAQVDRHRSPPLRDAIEVGLYSSNECGADLAVFGHGRSDPALRSLNLGTDRAGPTPQERMRT